MRSPGDEACSVQICAATVRSAGRLWRERDLRPRLLDRARICHGPSSGRAMVAVVYADDDECHSRRSDFGSEIIVIAREVRTPRHDMLAN